MLEIRKTLSELGYTHFFGENKKAPHQRPPPDGTSLYEPPRRLVFDAQGAFHVPVLRFYASCHTRATPTLHGAGGDARSGISDVLDLADEAGFILLAPESRGRSRDVLVGGYGPDVVFIDRSLGQ